MPLPRFNPAHAQHLALSALGREAAAAVAAYGAAQVRAGAFSFGFGVIYLKMEASNPEVEANNPGFEVNNPATGVNNSEAAARNSDGAARSPGGRAIIPSAKWFAQKQ